MSAYVIDTSTLIYDPEIIRKGFPGAEMVIPLTVVRELDGIKTDKGNRGVHARKVLRIIAELSDGSSTPLIKGVPRPCGGTFRVEQNHVVLKNTEKDTSGIYANDDIIINVAKNLSEETKIPHILVTQDRAMSIMASVVGVETTSHHVVDTTKEIPDGIVHVATHSGVINRLFKGDKVPVDELDEGLDLAVNTGVILKNGSQSVIGYVDKNGLINVFPKDIPKLYKIQPKGVEQEIAARLILGGNRAKGDNEFLASLSGRPGSGKTTLAIASGLAMVSKGLYDRIIVFRPTVNLSSNTDLGFLPGGIDEKLSPWTEAIHDVLLGIGIEDSKLETTTIKVKGKNTPIKDIVSVEPMNYIRGRTFSNTFAIVDEAQNLEPGELRTLLTRFGKGSACVMTWDQGQIDNNFIRSGKAEGPLSVLEKTKDSNMVFHVNLPRSERGGISSLFV